MKFSKRFWLLIFLTHLLTYLHSAPWWEVYFTAGDGVIGSASALEQKIGNFMSTTSSMCYVANYSWSDTATNEVVLKINSLYTSGTVDVKVVGDNAQGTAVNEPIHPNITSTIPMNDRTTAGSSEYMHDKVIIRDPNNAANAALMMGSGNYNEGGWESQNNTFLFLYNQALTLNYLAEFNEMFKGTFAGGTKTTRVYAMPNGTEVRSFFGSEDQPWAATATTANGLISLLNASTESIFFEITDLYGYSGIQNPMEASCVNRAAAGVIAEGVYQSIDTASSYDLTDWNAAANANANNTGPFIRESAVTAFTKHHHKYFVIDMDWAGVGSVNASQSSAETNPGSDENFILINDFRLAREFMKEFGRNYALTTPVGAADNAGVTEIHNWVSSNVPTGLSVTPAALSFAVSWTFSAAPSDFSRYYIFISTNNTIATAKEQTTDAQGGHKNAILRPEMQKKGRTTTSTTLTTYNEGDTLVTATSYYIGVVSVDKFGNESAALTGGPYQLSGAPNNPPNNPASLQQYKSDGITVIAVGAQTTETTVVLKGTVSDPDVNNVKLQVEVRATGTAFSNVSTHESGLVASGGTASVTVSGLTSGTTYHWQARTMDSVGAPSAAWVIFNGADGNHFVVQTAAPAATINDIKISEVGVNYAGVTANDYIELYNTTGDTITLTGTSIQRCTTNPGTITRINLTGTIKPYGFYLAADDNSTGTLLARADNILNNLVVNNDNLIAFVSNQTNITGSADVDIIDRLGIGANTGPEGTAFSNIPNGQTAERKAKAGSTAITMAAGGVDELLGNAYDTNDNSNDFVLQTSPVPQSYSNNDYEPPTAPPDTAAPGKVGLLTPANNAVNIATTTALTVNTSTDTSAPVSYYIQLALDSAFTSGVQFRDWNTSTSWTGPAPTLANDTTYYWKVKAKDSATIPNETAYKGHTLDVNGYGKFVTAAAVVNNPPTAPTGLGPVGLVSGLWTNSNVPSLEFTLDDPDINNVKYRLVIDDSADFLSPVVDYTSALAVEGAKTFTVGQAAGGGSYTVGAAGQTLADSAGYYWRVMCIDEPGLTSSYSVANGGAIAFKVDTSVGAPTSLDAGYNGTSSTLTWTASDASPSGLDTYNVYRATYSAFTVGGPNVTKLNGAKFTTALWDDTTVLADKTYYYGATAVDIATNISALSNPLKSVYTGILQSGGTNHIVISEIQVAGGTTTDEFVELYNPTNSDIAMSGWRLRKKNSAGAEANLVATLSGTIPAHGFFLIGCNGYDGAISTNTQYSTADNIPADGCVILYSDAGTTVVDKVGFGVNADSETVAFNVNPAANRSIERKANAASTADTMAGGGADELQGNGYDTNNNLNDFVYRTAADPQNSASATEPAPAGDTAAPGNVGLVTPANNAVNVSTTATLTVNTSTDTSTPINYWIQIALDAGFTTGLKETGWQTSTSTSPVLANSITYYWRVKAKDNLGNTTTYKGHTLDADGYGTFTTAAGAVVNSSPTAPTNGSPNDAVNWTNDPTPAFSWTFNDPDAGDSQSAYQLIGSGPGSYDTGKTASTSSFHTPGSSLADGSWSWQVKVWDVADSSSPWSASWTVKIDVTVPTTIADLTASLSGGSIQLNWSAPTDTSGVKNYKIWRSTQSLGANPVFIANDDSVAGYLDSSPIYGTTNYYYVSTVDNATNESAKSNIASCYIGPAGHIVISEIQIDGTAATDEFVELYNPTDSDVVMSGWRLRKKNSTGTEATLVATLSGTIPAHGFFLIGCNGYDGAVSTNTQYSTVDNIPADGCVILYSDAGVTIVDKVGTGASVDYETAAYGTNPAANRSIERKTNTDSTAATMGSGGVDELEGNGYDTDNNLNDFIYRTTSDPQNTNSQREPAIANITLSLYDVNPDTAIVTQSFTYTVTYKNVVSGDVPPDTKQVVIDGTVYPMNLTGSSYVGGTYTGNFSYSTTLSTGMHNYYFYFVKGPDSGRAPLTSPEVFNGPAVGPELEKMTAYGGTGLTTNPTDYASVSVTSSKTLWAWLSPGSNGWSVYGASITYWTSTTIATQTKTMTYNGTDTNYNVDKFYVVLTSGTDYKAGEWFYYYVRAGDANTPAPTFKFTDDAGDTNSDGWVSAADTNNNTVDSAHRFHIGFQSPTDGIYSPMMVKRTEPCITSDLPDRFENDFSWAGGWKNGDEVDDGGPNNLIWNNEDVAIGVSFSPPGAAANCTFYYTTNGNVPTTSDNSFSGGTSLSNNSNWWKSDESGMRDIRAFFPSDLNAAGCTIWILAAGYDGNPANNGTSGEPYSRYFKYYVGATPGTPSGDKDDAIVMGRGNRDGRYPTTDFDNYSPLRHSQNENISSTVGSQRYLAPRTLIDRTTDELVLNASFLTTAGHDGITDIFYSDQVQFYLRTAFMDVADDTANNWPGNQAFIVWLATTTDWSTAPKAALTNGGTAGDDNQPPHLLKYHWLIGENTGLEGYGLPDFASNPSDCTKGAPEGATVQYIFKVRDNQSSGAFKWIYKDPTTNKQRITDTASTAQATGNQFTYRVLQDDYTRPVAYMPENIPGVVSVTHTTPFGVVPATYTAPSWPTAPLGSIATTCGSTVETVKVYIGLFDTDDGRFTTAIFGSTAYIDNPNYVHRTFKDPNITNTNYYGNDVLAINTTNYTENSGIKGGRTDNSDSYAEGLEGYNSEGKRVTHDVLLYYAWQNRATWIDADGSYDTTYGTVDPGPGDDDSNHSQYIRIENVDGATDSNYVTQQSSAAVDGHIAGRVSMAPYNVESDGNGIWVAEIPAPSDSDIMVSTCVYLYYRIWASNGDNDPQAYYLETHGGIDTTNTTQYPTYAGSHGNSIARGDLIENPYGKEFIDTSDDANHPCGRVHDRDYGWVDITRYGGRITSPRRVMIKSKVTVGGVTRTITTYMKVDPTTGRPTNIISTQVGAE